MNDRRCENCLHWKRQEEQPSEFGECHATPPRPRERTLSENSTQYLYVWWPLTHQTDFCGKFQPEPVEQSYAK